MGNNFLPKIFYNGGGSGDWKQWTGGTATTSTFSMKDLAVGSFSGYGQSSSTLKGGSKLLRGQRRTSLGAIFKRELKITDVEGSKIKEGIVSEAFTDLFDGEVEFFPLLEDTVTLKKGEIPIGNTFASCNYLIESPIKRAPAFGSAQLMGLDLNIYHDNLNYNMDITLPDIEVYKFAADIPTGGVFPSASKYGGNVIFGSSVCGNSASIIENFDGQSAWGGQAVTTSSSLSSTKRNSDTGMYMTLDEAFEIQTSEWKGTKNTRGSGKGTKTAFRKQYARHRSDLGGYVVALQPEAMNKRQLETVHGKRWLSIDFSVCRSYYDYDYAVSKGDASMFIRNALRFEQDYSYSPPVSATESQFIMTTDDTSLEQVRYTPHMDDGEIPATITVESTPIFSSLNSPPSGTSCSMKSFWSINEPDETMLSFGDTDIGYQSQMIQTRIPKPLPLARQQAQNNELDSLVTEIKFNIVRLDKFHKSNVDLHANEPTGFNLTRSCMFMLATRPPDKDEDLAEYLFRMEGGAASSKSLTDRRNPNVSTASGYATIDNERNLYNGIAFIRMPVGSDRENESGDVRIVNTGKTAGSPMIKSEGINGQHLPFIAKQATTVEKTTGTTLTANSATIAIPSTAVQRGMIVTNREEENSVINDGDNGTVSSTTNLYSSKFKGISADIWNGYRIIVHDKTNDYWHIAEIIDTVPQAGGTDGYVTYATSGFTPPANTEFWIQQMAWPCHPNIDGKNIDSEIKYINAGVEGSSVTSFDLDQTLNNETILLTGNNPPHVQFRGGIHLDALDVIGDPDEVGTMFQTGEWYTLKIYVNGRRDYFDDSAGTAGGFIRWVLLDSQDRVVWTRRQIHMGNGSTGMTLNSGLSDTNLNTGWSFPSYLTIWCNNMIVGGGGNVADKYEELMAPDNGAIWSDVNGSEVHLALDSIKTTGFEPDVSNASITNNKNYRKPANIGSTSDLKLVDTVAGYATSTGNGWYPDNSSSVNTIGEAEPTYFDSETITYAVPYYLSWGFTESLGSRQNMKWSFFMGDYSVSDRTKNDISDDTKRIGFSSTGDSEDSDIIAFVSTDDTTYGLGMWGVKDRDGQIEAGIHINDLINIGEAGKNSVDGLTKKGFWELNIPHSTTLDGQITGSMAKRENPWFSTKIVKIWDAKKGIIEVANAGALNGFLDDEFIIYRAGSPYHASTASQISFRTGLTIEKGYNPSNGNKIKLKGSGVLNLSNSGDALVTEGYLHDLYISPYRYWVIMEIYNQAESGRELLPDKEYGFSVVANGPTGGAFGGSGGSEIIPETATTGLTFKETKYSDSTIYSNAWKISKTSSDGGLIEDGIDFGFGTTSGGNSDNTAPDLEMSLGYVKKYTPQLGYNNINLDNYISVESGRLSKPDEKVAFFVTPSPETSGVSSLRTLKWYNDTDGKSDTIKGDYEPYFTFYYYDELPVIDNITIQPDEDNPFYPKLTWEAQDDDLWYGFLLNDNKDIKHQYQNAVAHIPLNDIQAELQDPHIVGGVKTSARPITSKHVLRRYNKWFGIAPFQTGLAGQYNGDEVYGWRAGVDNLMSVEGLAGNALYCNGVNDVLDSHGSSTVAKENSSSWIEFNCFPHEPAYETDRGEVNESGRVSAHRWTAGGYTNPKEEFSCIVHFTCESITENRYIISRYQDFNIWIDTGGNINADFYPDNYDASTAPAITLKSTSIVNLDGETPHCVILTFDKEIVAGNVKLFIDGKLESQSGLKLSTGTAYNWKDGEDKAQNHTLKSSISVAPSLTIGRRSIQASIPEGSNILPVYPHHGKIEEIVIYDKVIFPFVPQTGEYLFTKPIKELTEDEIASGATNVVKIFIKDYHNIRGTSSEEVASSSNLSYKKGGLGLKTN